MSDSEEIRDSLQANMERLRSELAGQVDHVVEQAKEMTDWRGMLRHHPWICFGISVAVGYLLVPRRPRVVVADAKTLQELSKSGGLVIQASASKPLAGTLLNNLATAATAMAVRTLLGVAERRMSQFVATKNGTKRAARPTNGMPFYQDSTR